MALPRCRHLRLRNVPVLRMLQLEEALFRADSRSWLVTNEWDAAAPAAAAAALSPLRHLGYRSSPQKAEERRHAAPDVLVTT